MEQFVEGKNPYNILGLENGQKSTLDEIKKAYRRLALVKHPDKAKTPNAAQEFDELKKAYAILCDKSARGALDDYIDAQAAREARLAKQDAKRAKLREDLERKEQQGAAAKSEEEQARARLKVELEALRARAQQQQQQKHRAAADAAAAKKAASEAAAAAAAAGGGSPAADDDGVGSDDETTQLLLRTIKVSWDPTISSYSSDRLRSIFSESWVVEDVILKDSRKKKKAAALVVLGSQQEAQHAAQQVHGDIKNPLLVVPYLKVMHSASQAAVAGEQQQQQQQKQHMQGAAATAPAPASAAAGRQPLFAAAASASRPVQKPSKPLFPGAATPASLDALGTTPASGFPKAASSFPSSFPAVASSFPSNSQFSSFPSFPAPAAAGGRSIPVGSGFEDTVLHKLQQKSGKGQQQQQQQQQHDDA